MMLRKVLEVQNYLVGDIVFNVKAFRKTERLAQKKKKSQIVTTLNTFHDDRTKEEK